MAQVTMQRSYDAPAAVVWDVVTDHALYGRVAPNLASVEVVGEGGEDDEGRTGDAGDGGESHAAGAGEGMVRRCVDRDGNEWTERCHRWDEGRGFAVAVDVADSDFHRRLFDRFEGAWRLEERADDVLVTIQFEFEPKYGPLGWLVAKYFQYKAPGVVASIFDGWAAAIEDRRGDGRADADGAAAVDGEDDADGRSDAASGGDADGRVSAAN